MFVFGSKLLIVYLQFGFTSQWQHCHILYYYDLKDVLTCLDSQFVPSFHLPLYITLQLQLIGILLLLVYIPYYRPIVTLRPT